MDTDWTGGILLDHRKCVDHCTRKNGVCPAPSIDENRANRLFGLAFDKETPDNYYHNCDTFRTVGTALRSVGGITVVSLDPYHLPHIEFR